jgi:hypothetical protein
MILLNHLHHPRFLLPSDETHVAIFISKICFQNSTFTGVGDGAQVHEAFVRELLLAPPRKLIEKSAKARKDEENTAIPATGLAQALFFTSKRLLSELKIVIHKQIVLIGTSQVAFCFLKRLLSISYLRFASLTLVSPHGSIFPTKSSKWID